MGNTREEKDHKNKPVTIKKMVIGTYILIITLNVNGLNAPTRRHRLAEWIQKQDPSICCLQETHFRPRDAYRLEVRGWKKIFRANGNQQKAGVAILISDKIDFKIKTITRDKEGHYIMIKGPIQEEDITIVNIYAPNIGAPQYIRQMLTAIKGEIDSNTIIVGDFISLLIFYFYFWLRWVFVAVRGLSLVAASGGYSSLRCAGFSLWPLLLWSTGSRRAGFSS